MNGKVRENYENLARAAGLRMDPEGGALYGERGGFGVTVYAANPSYPYILTVAVSASRSRGELTKEECKQFKKEHKPVGALAQKGRLITMVLKNTGNQAKLQETLNEGLNTLTGYLRSNGFQNCCQACGKEEMTDTCYVSGGYLQLCPDCFTAIQQKTTMSAAENNQKRENLVGGIVGALLGSLLGVVSIVLVSQMGYVAALSGVIMAVCTLKGYELLGGKLSIKGMVISAAIMLVMTPIGDQIDWAIMLAREADVDIITAFRAVPLLISEGYIEMRNYLGNLVLIYFFLLLGAVPTIMNTMRNQKNAKKIYRLNRS